MSRIVDGEVLVIGLPLLFAVTNLAVALATGWWFCWFFTGAFIVQFAYELAEPRH